LQIIVQILDETRPLCDFELPLGSLGATYAVHRRLIGKRIVDFLLVLIELFFAEVLWLRC